MITQFPDALFPEWSTKNPAVKDNRVTGGKGVHIVFENGFTVSIQWGPGNYGDNYYIWPLDSKHSEDPKEFLYESFTAEVAVWDFKNTWVTPMFCDKLDSTSLVAGYLSVNEVFSVLEKVRDYQNTPENRRRIKSYLRKKLKMRALLKKLLEEDAAKNTGSLEGSADDSPALS